MSQARRVTREQLLAIVEGSSLANASRVQSDLRSSPTGSFLASIIPSSELIRIYERRRKRLNDRSVLADQVDAWLQALYSHDVVLMVVIEGVPAVPALLLSEDGSRLLAILRGVATDGPGSID